MGQDQAVIAFSTAGGFTSTASQVLKSWHWDPYHSTINHSGCRQVSMPCIYKFQYIDIHGSYYWVKKQLLSWCFFWHTNNTTNTHQFSPTTKTPVWLRLSESSRPCALRCVLSHPVREGWWKPQTPLPGKSPSFLLNTIKIVGFPWLC